MVRAGVRGRGTALRRRHGVESGFNMRKNRSGHVWLASRPSSPLTNCLDASLTVWVAVNHHGGSIINHAVDCVDHSNLL